MTRVGYMRRRYRRLFFLVAGVLLLCGSAWGIDGPEVIGKLQAQFDAMHSLSARFEKRHYWKLDGQAHEIEGRIYVQKPDRFRLETRIQTVVTDGETAWSYVPDNRQVLMQSYTSVKDDRSYEKQLFDLILTGGYLDRFVPRYAGEERVDRKACHLVELAARQDGAYISRVRLWVDGKEWQVRRVEYQNINDDITTYTLSDLKVNKKLKDGLFQFTPPKGVEVVDLR